MTVPKLRAPIVLVHGLLGYNQIKVCGWTLARYFPHIPEYLSAAGNRVLVPWVSPTGGIAERARDLKNFLDREAPGEPVHLIGHSLGGLDCRYMVSRLGMAERVLSLTTIGTPHRGSTFADWGLRRFERLLKPILDCLCIPYQAFYDLATVRCQEFNRTVLDVPGVRYYSVAGQFDGNWRNPEWQLPYRIVSQAEGPNDGVVSLTSASYGEDCEVWEGHHLSLVNWPTPVSQARSVWGDRVPHYARLLGRLADCGF